MKGTQPVSTKQAWPEKQHAKPNQLPWVRVAHAAPPEQPKAESNNVEERSRVSTSQQQQQKGANSKGCQVMSCTVLSRSLIFK